MVDDVCAFDPLLNIVCVIFLIILVAFIIFSFTLVNLYTQITKRMFLGVESQGVGKQTHQMKHMPGSYVISGSQLLIILFKLSSDDLVVNLSVGFSEAFVGCHILEDIIGDIEV